MDLNHLYSSKRTGEDNGLGRNTFEKDPRSPYQRDFDRIIFSSSFRRLQNKTQVFPLPGSVFVHNRLTHSLEVASVGRTLGKLAGNFIIKHYANDITPKSKQFYTAEISNVLASACLCHDIGNPAFGHSGEDAIATYFIKNESDFKSKFSEKQWSDFINFEGNANSIRILTKTQNNKSIGGLKLTYSTLAAIAKYPCESTAKDKNVIYRKKIGFFQSCKQSFKDFVAENTGMRKVNEEPLIFYRHPFVWLVEAADDICYHIIDLEDAHKLGIISFDNCKTLLIKLIDELSVYNKIKIEGKLNIIEDKNEQIAYLRSKAINSLINAAQSVYVENFEMVLIKGLRRSIFDKIKEKCTSLKEIVKFSVENIYNNHRVIEIELAGYNVIYQLLDHFISPILKDKRDRRFSDKKAVRLIPKQFIYEGNSDYDKVMGVLDFVSGMTDNYASELYKRIRGIEIGMRL